MTPENTRLPLYGEPTNSVTVRIPASLHEKIKSNAKRDRTTKSRKIVELLHGAVGSEADHQPGADAVPAESVFE